MIYVADPKDSQGGSETDPPKKKLKRKKHSCEFCGFCTNWKSHFKIHMRTHTGKMPYVCNLCNFRANVMSNLKSHMHSCSRIEKHYDCKLCDFRTNW